MATGKEAEFKTEIASVHPFQNMFNSIQCTEINCHLNSIKGLGFKRSSSQESTILMSHCLSQKWAPLLFLSWFLLVSVWLCRQVFTFYLDLELWAISFFHHRMQSLKCCATVTQDRLCQRHYWGPWGPPLHPSEAGFWWLWHGSQHQDKNTQIHISLHSEAQCTCLALYTISLQLTSINLSP